MNILTFISILFFIPIYSNRFSYDVAARALQEGKWAQAYEQLVPLVTDNPDRADLLYDTGVAAYNMQKYPQALTYFLHAAEHAQDNQLKARAYFNAGNAAVEDKDLHKAVEYYDEVL